MTRGSAYAGKSSPWWYDAPQFHELLDASGNMPVRELIARLDGCTGARAGEIVADAGLARVACREVSRSQAEKLLTVARKYASAVNPKRLGAVGADLLAAYATSSGEAPFGAGSLRAEIPFVIEAWAVESKNMWLTVCVNRTPVTGDIRGARQARDLPIRMRA
jgi:hypothetical protein